MNSIVNSTNYYQVAAKLRDDIITNKILAGTPLMSIRRLADEFRVGRQVVYSALRLLEIEGLVESRERQGFLVCERNTASTTGIMFLAYGVNENNQYLQHLKALASPPFLPEGFNSWSRVVPRKLASAENWEMELRRISRISGIDYLLIHGAALSVEQVEVSLTLPLPVIYLADFSDAACATLPICHVVAPPESEAVVCLDYLKNKKVDHFVLLSYSRRHSYMDRYLSFVEEEAASRNMALQILELPKVGKSKNREEELAQLRVILQQLPQDVGGLYLAGVPYGDVLQLSSGTEQNYPIISTTSSYGLKGAAYLEPDFSAFYKKIYDLCRAGLNGENIIGRHAVKLNYQLINQAI